MKKPAKGASTRRKKRTGRKSLTSTVVRSKLPRTLDQDDFDVTSESSPYPASPYQRGYET